MAATFIVLILLAGAPVLPPPDEDVRLLVSPYALTMEARPSRSGALPRQRHTLLFGIAYEPGPGPRLFGQYVYLTHPSGYITTELGWGQELFGALSYTQIVDLDPWGQRRIAVTPSLFSAYEPNRQLSNGRVDVRRTGGGMRAATELPIVGRWQYGQDVRAEFARVHLDPDEGDSSLRDLTTVELTPRLLRRAVGGLLPVDLLVESRLRGGWDHGLNASYGRILLGLRWHRSLGAGFASSTEALGEWVSPDAPEYEHASFGGTYSVRGYPPDHAIGRTLWRVQQELWIPIPGTVDAVQGIGFILDQHVRLAAFFDVGGANWTQTNDDVGLMSGTGIGLRLRMGGITLRTDWGHTLPDLADGHLRGDFFVSLRSDVTLLLFQ